ncbi:MAG: NUDIX domain-containing protein [Candidatus Poseidoniaceae archaeon]
MSEVPSGVSMPDFERKPPRPSATLMVTRDGDDGVEVLLGQRCETMPSFPGYWAFPGGGVSRVDKPASEVIGISVQHCAILRELVEELGLAPQGGKLVCCRGRFQKNGSR